MWTTSPGSNRLIVSDPGDLYYCLDYREKDGVVEGSFMKGECDYSSLINISSTGPCILPLTAGDISLAHTLSLSVTLVGAILCVTAVNLRRWTNHFTQTLCNCGSKNNVKTGESELWIGCRFFDCSKQNKRNIIQVHNYSKKLQCFLFLILWIYVNWPEYWMDWFFFVISPKLFSS